VLNSLAAEPIELKTKLKSPRWLFGLKLEERKQNTKI
jgi:hypothetical protein